MRATNALTSDQLSLSESAGTVDGSDALRRRCDRDRQEGQPSHVLQISNRAQQRLYRVHRRMRTRGKPGNVAVVACARELSCFLWAAVTAD